MLQDGKNGKRSMEEQELQGNAQQGFVGDTEGGWGHLPKSAPAPEQSIAG